MVRGFHGCDIGKATSLQEWDDWNTNLKPAYEPIVMARKPISETTVVKNVLKWGVGAINIGANRNPTTDNLGGHRVQTGNTRIGKSVTISNNEVSNRFNSSLKVLDASTVIRRSGRYTTNVFIDDDVASAIDAVTPHTKSSAAAGHHKQNESGRVVAGLNPFTKRV